jgi:hypothetical protein
VVWSAGVWIPNLAWEPKEDVLDGGLGDGWMIDGCEMIDTPLPHFEARSFMNYVFRLATLFLLFGVRKGAGKGAGKEERKGSEKRRRRKEKEKAERIAHSQEKKL